MTQERCNERLQGRFFNESLFAFVTADNLADHIQEPAIDSILGECTLSVLFVE